MSPYFSKDFIIFSFASEHTIVGVLMQKNQQNAKQPISLFNKVFMDGDLKYDIMEKKAYGIGHVFEGF